jgi:hypothetical protein
MVILRDAIGHPPTPTGVIVLRADRWPNHSTTAGLRQGRARSELISILGRHPRIDTNYLREISDANVVVDGYKLHLRASLSGNLDLSRMPRPDESGANGSQNDEWKKVLRTVNPETTRLVLLTREEELPPFFPMWHRSLDLNGSAIPLCPMCP